MKAKSIMLQGTASDSGKSTLATALCRYYANHGHKVFPFKSQNMALNAAYTADGKQMSKAQLIQAEAAKREPDIRMNPIFLKAQSQEDSQVIVMGETVASMPAKTYQGYKKTLKPQLRDLYEEIEKENDLIVIEGAGSAAEINLREDDLVNMGMADIADAPVILVADIDLGGVFASLYGTVMLQEERHRQRIKGLIINKFRGDLSILENGLSMIEELTEVPVLGVIPYLDLNIEEEDSVALSRMAVEKDILKDLDLAVLAWPGLSNFSNLASLRMQEDVSLRFIHEPHQFGRPDLLILADSIQPERAWTWMKDKGLDHYVSRAYQEGTYVMALGGAKDFFGSDVVFKDGVRRQGLALTNASYEERDQLLFEKDESGQRLSSFYPLSQEEEKSRLIISEDVDFFDRVDEVRTILNHVRQSKGLQDLPAPKESYADYKDRAYDQLAEEVSQHLDMDRLDQIIFGH